MVSKSFITLLSFAFIGSTYAVLQLPPPVPRSGAAQCFESDPWPPGPGGPLVPQAPSSELKQILSQIDPKRIEAIINKLVSFGTRHTLSSQTDPNRGIGAARDWLASEMRNLTAAAGAKGHNITVELQSFIQPPASRIPTPTNITNVITTIQGTENSNRVYIITGHYDSRCTDIMNFTSDAPGADDDGSGVAVVLELVRILSTMPPPKATIMLGAVAGEEQDLFGSTFFAQQAKANGLDVQGMFTNDIVGASKGDPGTSDPNSIRLFAQGVPTLSATASQINSLVSIGGENDSPARELARWVLHSINNIQALMRVVYRLDRYLRGGDHEPFLQEGYPAARFTEPHENFAHQHQDVRVDNATGIQFGDLPEFCDFDFNARVAKVNAAAIWSLAQAPATPKNVTIDTSVLTNNSTFFWPVDATGEVAGYEVLWRETNEPFWTNVVPVGLVSKATVDQSKDNVVFGIRAVGKNGYRSPAALPFPN
ncbi:Zn-dependent exopeptidase [Abortiporus biennis]|nr:Zn-dependent exopeptidase [Abortiporus biennis]